MQARDQGLFFRRDPGVGTALGRVGQAGELLKTETTARYLVDDRVFGKYAIVYLLGGSGLYMDATAGSVPVSPGSLIIIFPTVAHRYGPRVGEDWHEIYLVFEGPIFAQWEQAGLLDPRKPVWRLPAIGLWKKRIMAVPEPGADVSASAALLEVCRMQQLLADMRAALQPRPAHWLLQAQTALEQDQPLEKAARSVGCSYAAFRRRFTQLQGLSPGRYRMQRRIERACALMHRGQQTDKQIAAELGFCDEFHFSRAFKQQVGLSPRAYRRGLP